VVIGQFLTFQNVKVRQTLLKTYSFILGINVCYFYIAEVYCGPVPQIDNGFSTGSTNVTYRGQAMYQCYAGFAFPSNEPIEKVSCLADGRWERLPTCLGKHIVFLFSFENKDK